MNRKIILILGLFVLLLQTDFAFAQNGNGNYKKPKIAIFAPLFLDSAFDASNNYRYGKEFPKFINPGLEFIAGVQLALDSLQKEGLALDVQIFDSRSSKSISDILNSLEMNGVDLIIGHTTAPEMISLAEFAARMKVPFINPNLPFDGGVINNPYLVLLNSTLKTHCEGIYQYLQKNYAGKKLVVFRQKGALEDMLKNYLLEYGKLSLGIPLKIKFVDLKTNFTDADLLPHLDSINFTLCIAGSLDENFGRKLSKNLASLNVKYPVSVMGMPTWDVITEFRNAEYKGLEIIFSTPFYNSRENELSRTIVEQYNSKMYARPSDMVFRGYETTWRFSKLLLEFKKDLPANLTHMGYNAFRNFDIQPIFTDRQNMTLDYFENKKLYFVKKVDGIVKSVN